MSGRDWVDCTCCGAVAGYDNEHGEFIDGTLLLCGCDGYLIVDEDGVDAYADECWCAWAPLLKRCIDLQSPDLAAQAIHTIKISKKDFALSEMAGPIPPPAPTHKPIDKDDFGDDEKTDPLIPIDWEALRKQYGGSWAGRNQGPVDPDPALEKAQAAIDGWDNDYVDPGVPIPDPPKLKDLKPLTIDGTGKVVCDCGSTKLGSDIHSDWCSLEQLGIKP